MKESIKESKRIILMIAKLVIPFSMLSEVLQYLGVVDYVGFIFEPATQLLKLPADVAVAFAASFFLNIYAGIAVASGLDLSPYEWTIVGTFIAICHSIPLESAVMKKVGFPIHIHWISRLCLGILGAWVASFLTPQELVGSVGSSQVKAEYASFGALVLGAFSNALLLTLKISILVATLVVAFDLIKKRAFFKALLDKHTYLSSMTVGCLLGVTYGAGILLKDIKSVEEEQRLYLLTFLLLAHGLIEETLIFAIFGADIVAILLIRLGIAISVVVILIFITKKLITHKLVRLKSTNE
ncbi:hypothetical protein [Endozoicomonas sp. SESOKO3]|uniref:hypothetical protein n=1 Tax=Endozoicomonas sp. SESOKO3 TaxID=2828744 RepID=UPI0021474179|nr:hypothetical protein [Endozoicomonas sp. SESOKO3]